MSAPVIIQAVKIKIVPVISGLPEHTELGVFVNSSVSQEIRWTEMPLVGVAEAWTSGIIAKNGIGDIRREMDTRAGGAPEAYSGLQLKVLNNNQLILRLKELGIDINGLTAEVHEFIGTDADSDAVETSVRFTGVCAYESASSWDENLWNIEIKNNRFRRNAFLGTLINNSSTNGNYPLATDDMNGKIVPITMGKFEMINDAVGVYDPLTSVPNPAKFIRTAGKQRTLSNSGLFSGGKYFTPIDQRIFPVVGNFIGFANSGTNIISGVGCASKLVTTDVIRIHSGFSSSYVDRNITNVSGNQVTVDGAAATSTTVTYIDFLHKANETESPAPCYVLMLGTGEVGAIPETWPADDMQGFMESILNKWIQVIEGGAVDGVTSISLSGKYKRISAFQLFDLTYGQMVVTVAVNSFFEKNLSGRSDAEATNQTWVSIVDIPFQFSGDVWPMKGFLDDAGNVIDTSTAEALWLYAYKSDASFLERKSYDIDTNTDKLIITTSMAPVGFIKIAPYGYKSGTGSLLNFLVIDALLFKDDPSQLLSWDIFKFKSLEKYSVADLSAYDLAGMLQLGSSNIYLVTADLSKATIVTNTDISGTDWCDQSDASKLSLNILLNLSSAITSCASAYELTIDNDKIKYEYDSYFLGINCHTKSGVAGTEFDYANTKAFLLWRRFTGKEHETLIKTDSYKYNDTTYPLGVDGGDINNLPDFYYTIRTPDLNKAFIFEKTLAASEHYISGHKLFQIRDVTTADQLKSIFKIGMIFQTYPNTYYSTFTKLIELKELALICQMSASISSELYPLCAGRIFNSTWGARKISTNMISNAIDQIEYFKRLQCGMEFGDQVEFGKAYSPSMPIKTGTGDGSYDHSILSTKKTFTPVFQIHDAGRAWTDTQIRELCRTFHVCTYTDRLGYECITTLDTTDPTETILFTDIKGSIGETKEPQISDVYCQPIFNYRYNYGSEKFDKQMCILNIQAAAYDPAFTPGIDNTAHNLHVTLHDGEYVWTQCKANYEKYRQIEPCPSSFSDQKMIATYVDAIKIFSMKIAWMGKNRQPLSVFYSKGKDYHPGMHLKIMLPHQTNRMTVECMIETLKISKNRNQVDLLLVLLEDVATAFFFE